MAGARLAPCPSEAIVSHESKPGGQEGVQVRGTCGHWSDPVRDREAALSSETDLTCIDCLAIMMLYDGDIVLPGAFCA